MSTTPMPSPAPAAAAIVSAPVESVPAAAVVSPVPTSDTPAPLNFATASDDQLAARYGVTEPEDASEPQVVIAPDVPVVEAAPVVEAPAVVPPEPKQPITPFTVFDAEGELEIPDVTLSFKAGGKEYEKVPLDRVVRMAQSAPLAEKWREAAEQLPQVQETVQQVQTAYTQAVQQIEANNALYERLLSNPELYVQAVEAYQQMQSPQARAERAEQEAAGLRLQQQQVTQQQQTQQTLAAANAFAQANIAPVIAQLQTQYAHVLDADEITDRFHTLTADLLEAGPHGRPWVPPTKLGEVERRVRDDLTVWAEARAQKRSQSHATATQQATTALQQAQTDAQMAKRQLARAVSPARTAVAPDVPREKPIKTAQDAMDASLEKVRRMAQGLA